MSIEFRPMSDAGGAEVIGIDVKAVMPDADLAAVEQAFLNYGVLLFREQPMMARELVAFSRQFGELQPHVQ
ncbi:MAG: TauD/TfdA family dioxygenase, partial [Pseudomonadota bacterium]|nr:TauD/TfdA family dioxygenase [Pseudomonadota bacterium]